MADRARRRAVEHFDTVQLAAELEKWLATAVNHRVPGP